ncbi:MAG: hypothetical protein AAFY03_01270, partial [Pseudomonadota bacterium]
MTTAATLIAVVQWYCLIGAMVALAFLLIGIDRIDEDARGAYVFRPLLIPAILLIWPLVVWRWWVLETGRDRWEGKYTPPRASHGVAAFGMAAFIVLALMASFAIRQTWPAG